MKKDDSQCVHDTSSACRSSLIEAAQFGHLIGVSFICERLDSVKHSMTRAAYDFPAALSLLSSSPSLSLPSCL